MFSFFAAVNAFAGSTYQCRASTWKGESPLLGDRFAVAFPTDSGPTEGPFTVTSSSLGECEFSRGDILDNLDFLTNLYSLVKLGGKKCKAAGTILALDRATISEESAGYISVMNGPQPDQYRCSK